MKSLSQSQEVWGLRQGVCVFVTSPSEESNLCQLLGAWNSQVFSPLSSFAWL